MQDRTDSRFHRARRQAALGLVALAACLAMTSAQSSQVGGLNPTKFLTSPTSTTESTPKPAASAPTPAASGAARPASRSASSANR